MIFPLLIIWIRVGQAKLQVIVGTYSDQIVICIINETICGLQETARPFRSNEPSALSKYFIVFGCYNYSNVR